MPDLISPRRRRLGYLAYAVLLPVLAYRVFWSSDEAAGVAALALTGVALTAVLVAYAARCIRFLRGQGAGAWGHFLALSLLTMSALLLSFASIYRVVGLTVSADPPGARPCRDPGACLYFAVITWTTVGYGDLTPTHAARPFAALEAVIGYLFMAFFIPTLIHATTRIALDQRRRDDGPTPPGSDEGAH
jgi:hypothetical protein